MTHQFPFLSPLFSNHLRVVLGCALLRGRSVSTLLLVPLACTNDPEGASPDVPSPCEGAACDSPASSTPTCFEQGCPSGEICSAQGSCVLVRDDIEVSGSGGAAEEPVATPMGGANGCVEVEVEFESVIPTVAFLIDRSNSMQGFLGFDQEVEAEFAAGSYEPWGCPTDPEAPLDDPEQSNWTWRWNVLRNVLFHPEKGVVSSLQDQVRFGMTLYTHDPNVSELCPDLIEVEFDLGHEKKLRKAMKCDDLGRFTPTGESLMVVAKSLRDLDVEGEKMIVLATDGAPTSCECPSFRDDTVVPVQCRSSSVVERDGMSMSPQEAVEYDLLSEVTRIYEEWGIVINVIDMSAAGEVDFRHHLTELADRGGGAVYDGLRPTGLSEAFFSSVQDARSCTIDLGGEIVPGYEEQGTVTLDGQPVMLAPPGADGYRVVSPSRLELMGAPCLALKGGNRKLEISFPCDSFVEMKIR